MNKKIYIKPQTTLLHISQDTVLASESWYDGHGNWNQVVNGNPTEEVDPYYSKQSFTTVWEKWDQY